MNHLYQSKTKRHLQRKKNPAFAWSRLELSLQIAHVMYHCPFQPYCLHLTTVMASLVLGCINYVLSSELSKKICNCFLAKPKEINLNCVIMIHEFETIF